MSLLKIILHISLVFCFVQASAQDTVSVMTYNVLNYPNANGIARNADLKTVVSSVNPDLLFVQEMLSLSGVNLFLNNVLNIPGTNYASAFFVNGFDSDRNLYYNTNKFSFIFNTPISTALRDINKYELLHLASGDTIVAFTVHLKASSGTTNQNKRAAEVDSLRKESDQMAAGKNFFLCGDFNIYGSYESAYQKLLEVKPGLHGHFNDLFNISGTWNNSSYANFHTQSTAVSAPNGGAGGGLDDRFDMILFSDAMMSPGNIDYLANSYRIVGNDGNHYNGSLTTLPNAAVADSISLALYNASDHLPVVAEFIIADELQVDLSSKIDATCSDSNDGTIDITVNGGAAPFTFNWSSGTTNEDLSAIGQGTYTVTVTGSNSEQVTFSTSISAPPAIQLTTSKQNVSCNTLANGTAQVITSGGAGTYTYSWNTNPVSSTSSVNQLTGGLYTVTVTDQDGCSKVKGINIFEPTVLSAFSIPTNPSSGMSDGSINLLVSGGVAPYTYSWSTGATTEDVFNLPTGLYFVTVSDKNGCAKVHVVILN